MADVGRRPFFTAQHSGAKIINHVLFACYYWCVEPSTDTITWQAYEHEPLSHEADWFWALGIITVAAAATSIILGNVLFGLLLLIAGGVLAMLARREQQLSTFILSSKGLTIDGTRYPLKDLLGFSIKEYESPDLETGEVSTSALLLIDTPRFMTPDLAIPIVGVNPETVYLWLTEHEVPEKELNESLALKVLTFFGF